MKDKLVAKLKFTPLNLEHKFKEISCDHIGDLNSDLGVKLCQESYSVVLINKTVQSTPLNALEYIFPDKSYLWSFFNDDEEEEVVSEETKVEERKITIERSNVTIKLSNSAISEIMWFLNFKDFSIVSTSCK